MKAEKKAEHGAPPDALPRAGELFVRQQLMYGITSDIKALLEQPESENLEFKERIPDPPTLARIISAFANTDGGTLLIGFQEGGRVVGADYRKVDGLGPRQVLDMGQKSAEWRR